MSNWTKAELKKIAAADDLHISPLHEYGVTYGTPTWIWSVVTEGELYARAYSGQNSRWYKARSRRRPASSESREWSVKSRSSL
jgi:hypothetical protein